MALNYGRASSRYVQLTNQFPAKCIVTAEQFQQSRIGYKTFTFTAENITSMTNSTLFMSANEKEMVNLKKGFFRQILLQNVNCFDHIIFY